MFLTTRMETKSDSEDQNPIFQTTGKSSSVVGCCFLTEFYSDKYKTRGAREVTAARRGK